MTTIIATAYRLKKTPYWKEYKVEQEVMKMLRQSGKNLRTPINAGYAVRELGLDAGLVFFSGALSTYKEASEKVAGLFCEKLVELVNRYLVDFSSGFLGVKEALHDRQDSTEIFDRASRLALSSTHSEHYQAILAAQALYYTGVPMNIRAARTVSRLLKANHAAENPLPLYSIINRKFIAAMDR